MAESKKNKESLRIRDLVEMPAVKTVIQLQDLTDPDPLDPPESGVKSLTVRPVERGVGLVDH